MDLIERQAAIDALGEAPEVWTDSPEEFAALSQWEMDVTAIKALPSAEPETGKWIKAADDGVWSYADVYAECNKCHKVTFNGWNMNYCPNCGKYMIGEHDD